MTAKANSTKNKSTEKMDIMKYCTLAKLDKYIRFWAKRKFKGQVMKQSDWKKLLADNGVQ